MELQDLKEPVKNGAAFLDKECPGWANSIDINILDLNSYKKCIVGQLVSKNRLINQIDYEDSDKGFCLSSEEILSPEYTVLSSRWDDLKSLWVEEIRQRV